MKKIIFLAIALCVFAIAGAMPAPANAYSVGVLTDIHAARLNWNYQGAIKNLPEKDLWISLGDNMDKKVEFCQKVKDAFSGRNFITTIGNHERPACVSVFGNGKYFYKDIENTRIIIVDTSKKKISKSQLAWFKSVINTDKNIVIASHRPLIKDKKAMAIMKPHASKIQYVFSGHNHKDSGCIIKNKISFCRIKSFLSYRATFTFNLK